MLYGPVVRGTAAGSELIFHFFCYDTSVSTGAGLPSKIYSDFTISYQRQGEALSSAITPQAIAAIGTYVEPTANTNCRIGEVLNAAPTVGEYELFIHHDWVAVTNTPDWLRIFVTVTGGKVDTLTIPLKASASNFVYANITGKPIPFWLIDTVSGGPVTGSDESSNMSAQVSLDGANYVAGSGVISAVKNSSSAYIGKYIYTPSIAEYAVGLFGAIITHTNPDYKVEPIELFTTDRATDTMSGMFI
jgi:hypothetical protein